MMALPVLPIVQKQLMKKSIRPVAKKEKQARPEYTMESKVPHKVGIA